MKNRMTMTGFAATVLGLMLVFGQAFGSGGVPSVLAGNGTFTPVPDPTVVSPTSIPATCVPGQTCPNTATPNPSVTPGRSKTHTPTATATPAATEPARTVEATSTSKPATPGPSSGNEGANVKPPNTGTGGGSTSSDRSLWILMAGGLLMVLGSGAALVGIRQRR